ncbi:MAG: methyltransferase domain-containing protein [Planctomycetota bacterium]|nr:methyltransferase domain-containing protein [Planctomycetota bacterium]
MKDVGPLSKPSTPERWNDLYADGSLPWDKGGPSPPLVRFLAEQSMAPARILVPGCGRGHEAVHLDQDGHDVVAIDFAPLATVHAQKTYPDSTVDWRVADFFTFLDTGERFDVCVEHTLFCAIDPKRRDEYVEAVLRLLRPGGSLIGVFYAHGKDGGPPFTTTEAEIRRRFGKHFSFPLVEVPRDSFPNRAGKEILVWMERLD